MKFQICYERRRFFSTIMVLLLNIMMTSGLYAYALDSEPNSVDTQEPFSNPEQAAAGTAGTVLPPLVFVENSGGSNLSRVFHSLLLPIDQEAGQSTEKSVSPAVSQEEPKVAEPERDFEEKSSKPARSALRSLLLTGGLGVSWGLIVLLTLRLVFLKKAGPQHTLETDTITSTGYQILGEIAAENHKFQLAEQCYRKIAEKESYNKEIHYEIGKALFHAEHYHDAIKEFQIALGSEIVSTEIYGFLTKAYQAVNQPERAAQYSQKALQFSSTTSSRKKEVRNVIPLQRRLKHTKAAPRQTQKISA